MAAFTVYSRRPLKAGVAQKNHPLRLAWMMLHRVGAKCDGYKKSGYIRPFVKPVSLTFKVGPEKTVTILNKKYNFNNLLIGESYRSGEEANAFINNEIKKVYSEPNKIELISFSMHKSETIFEDERLSIRLTNPYLKELAAEAQANSKTIIAALEKKYGLPADSKHLEIQLLRMDWLLTEFTGEAKVILTDELLSFEPTKGYGISFYYGELMTIISNHWKILKDEAQNGLILTIEKGQNKSK